MSNLKLKSMFIKHRSKINAAISIAGSFTDFALTKSPFSFVRGGLETLNMIYNTTSPSDIFNQSDGWKPLEIDNFAIQYSTFSTILNKFTNHSIKTEWRGNARIICLPFTEIGAKEDSDQMMFYKVGEDPNKILKFLCDELLASAHSNLFSFTSHQNPASGYMAPSLICQDVVPFKSKKSEELRVYIDKAMKEGFNRSLLLYGPPGTGKSAIANYLISEFNFRTLRIDANKFSSTMRAFYKLFNFDAILIDDIDRLDEDSPLLLFLEEVKRNCKLVVGTCNSLKKFNAAVRPGRFDELIEIKTLDQDTVKSMLGHLNDKWFDKVSMFPAAYLNEFIIRSKLYDDLDAHYFSLKERVESQLKEIDD